MITLSEGWAGFVHELFYSATYTLGSFLPGKPMKGFVAGNDGVGHIVMVVPDWTSELEKFVTEVLGMKLYAGFLAPAATGETVGPQFFRCNPRTHCLAYVAVPGLRGAHHLALEANSLDDVGRAWDLVQEGDEYQVTVTLGRHMPDTLVSFYMRSPSGFDIEFGCEGLEVEDEGWVARESTAVSLWGHDFSVGFKG